ncbi:leucine-rich repeat protein soc-2-like [Rhodamnia argentea]|uniref:Leucine-rich repeat protein soc-2-like n=1 Tax=Rhodamnia argentea TaxID=178133 RepID=A0ABM3HBS8_9MYRT|nr:leucine-rich repeat protein soc-2-like [Rhodamnia argentea]
MNLKHLSINQRHKMEKLSFSVGKLASLSELDISKTNITSLPDSIGNAKHLSSLDLSYTSIMELPISIGELTQLEFLSLHRCIGLRELPESIGNLTSLQKLYISETSIVELPDSIKNLKQLRVMRMERSLTRKLPASIGMLERLEELNAQFCELLAGELPSEIGGLSSLRILDISYTHVCAVPTTINSLTQLQQLDLTYCNELQELPKLPSSLNCLRVQSTSLRLVPNLGNLTNLVELFLANRLGRGLSWVSMPMQTRQLQWVKKLYKLGKLSWDLFYVPIPLTDLACLARLRELTLYGMGRFNSVVVGPQFSNLKNLSSLCLDRSQPREIRLNGLELLRDLAVRKCMILEGLSVISSSLRKLRKMTVSGCPKLLEIRFLGAMESLERLDVERCHSLGGLYGLSNAIKLKALCFFWYTGLPVVEGLEELELLNNLKLESCGSLEMLTNVSNSKIPNECKIYVSDCADLPDTKGREFDYEEYREMIFGGMRKTFNTEDVINGSRCRRINDGDQQLLSSVAIGSPDFWHELGSRSKLLLLE